MSFILSSDLGETISSFTVTVLNNPPYLTSAITPNPNEMIYCYSYQIVLPIFDIEGSPVMVQIISAPPWVTVG